MSRSKKSERLKRKQRGYRPRGKYCQGVNEIERNSENVENVSRKTKLKVSKKISEHQEKVGI